MRRVPMRVGSLAKMASGGRDGRRRSPVVSERLKRARARKRRRRRGRRSSRTTTRRAA